MTMKHFVIFLFSGVAKVKVPLQAAKLLLVALFLSKTSLMESQLVHVSIYYFNAPG